MQEVTLTLNDERSHKIFLETLDAFEEIVDVAFGEGELAAKERIDLLLLLACLRDSDKANGAPVLFAPRPTRK